MSLLGAGRVRELLDRQGVRPSKALGQNFVIDPNTIRKIVALSGVTEESKVLEIGGGTGSLTAGLAETGAQVISLEFDPRLVGALAETTEPYDNVTIVEGDALRFGYSEVDADHLVANLPYNIAVPVVLRALAQGPQIGHLTVMTQKEVGARLAAEPGSKDYGIPSVLVAYDATAKVAGKISRNVFYPVPNVDSVVVRIDRHPPLSVDRSIFTAVVASAFGQRRKTLRNTLGPTFGSTDRAEEVLISVGITPSRRAEGLSPDEFMTLARAVELQA